MKRLLAIGVILLFVGLALAPPINAVKQKNDEESPNMKYPNLYELVLVILNNRFQRFVADIPYEVIWIGHGQAEINVLHPILFLRCMMLLATTVALGWDWDFSSLP